MNRYDESIKFASLSPLQPSSTTASTTTSTRPSSSSISFSFSMNFDDNDEPRRAIGHEIDDQKLAPSGDLAINANDVLCGRGKTSFNHVGNRRFRSIISESIDDYNSASSRKAKSAVVKKVHDTIRATGGRFLKLDSSQRMWVELTQQRSLEKVSHAIRDATSTNENMKKKKKQVHNTIAQVAAHVQSRFPSVHLEGKLDDDDDDDHDGDGLMSSERLAFKSVDSLGLHMSMPTLPGAAALHVTSGAGGLSTSPHFLNDSMGDDEDSSSRSAAARLETSAMLPVPTTTRTTGTAGAALEERPMPPLHHPSQLRQHHSSIEERAMPMFHRSTSSSASAPAKLHFAEDIFLQGPAVHHSSSSSSSRRLSSNLLGGTDDEEMPPLRSSLQPTTTKTSSSKQEQQHHHHEDDFLSYINEVLGPVSPTDLDIDPLKKLAKRNKKNDDDDNNNNK